ncbi:DUF3784 domain-containing protein [Evansella tamaricis]|uniref:DUF3784 domain-containing protein n=1 Tax=Evansella tamaricis TaxID=2069301 RepID=A0ABS6JD48_9BACI|nr:DUF3784 domain-containing protein [Evansella tamaricis]MBU9711602.1 DUF3784 domain-containing protein [Evansella tamaricis]
MEIYQIIILIIQIPVISMLLGFGYLIKKKQYYDLISGFSMKSKEEQEEMIRNGYPEAVGNVMLNSGYIIGAGVILFLFNVPFAFEASLGIMMIYMFTHLLLISKLDAKRVRKRNTIILAVTAVFTVGIIGAVFYIGAQPNELTVEGRELHISGVYGLSWELDDITKVELVKNVPEIQMRSNGFSHGQRAKGKFRLDELGNGTLFLYRDTPPFLYIERGEDYLFINSRDAAETLIWYERVIEAMR